jgi:hypothetical protein
MTHRDLASLKILSVLVIVVTALALAPLSVAAQTAPEGWTVPRTASGHPDLQGVWDFRSLTPMERPAELGEKDVLSEEEAAGFAAQRAAANAALDEETPYDTVGNYNQFWMDYGSRTVETNRTSLIVDPPNGRIPVLTPEAERRRAAGSEAGRGQRRHTPTPGGFVEDLGPGGLQVRCILGFNSGPPMTPGAYNNNVQLIQNDGHVVLLNEMVHNARIVPMDGRPHVDLPQWVGDSRGHWDGDTLVIETTNFQRETSFQSGLTTTDFRLTERLTRVAPDVLMYEATIEDPSVWTEPWTYAIPMVKSEFPVYEYACHEGNYGLYNILAGAKTNPEANVMTPEEAKDESERRAR